MLMNKTGKTLSIILAIIIIASIGAYAYIQSTNPASQNSPSPSPTATLSPSPTPAPTASPTPTQAPTETPAPSVSPSPTIPPTQAPTQTPTPTNTPAPTVNPTPTPAPTPTPMPSPITLTVSSTTSLYETGVENDVIKPAFQAKYPWITLNFLAQGTGAAIQTAMRGDADMIMVHDPAQEKTFMANGYGVNRKIIAYNFFIIVGPANDPANLTGMAPIDAMKKIYQLGQSGQAIWVSRGDGSGTNSKEKNLWAAAGINWTQIRTQTSWYKETGQGMTSTLIVANYLGGYTLADTASYLTNIKAKNIQSTIVVQGHKDLLNVYSVIADNPQNANLTSTHFDASMLFIQYMVSDEGQQLLANYGMTNFGQSLFSPFVPLASNPSLNSTLLGWIQNYAYIPANVTECPSAYRYNAGNLYSASYDTLASTSSTATINPVPNWTPNGEPKFTVDFAEATVTQPFFSSYMAPVLSQSSKTSGKDML